MKPFVLPAVVTMFTLPVLAALHAQSGPLQPGSFRRIADVDPRFVSYNVEMVEVTGGRFWAPYKTEPSTAAAGGATPLVAGLDAKAFRTRAPLDLGNDRLRTLAAALGPAYMRVSGTWANSTYFHDADDPPPARPPEGFGGVLMFLPVHR